MVGTVSEDVKEAIVNEYAEILKEIGPSVELKRLPAPPGSLCLWEFTVNANTYYIEGQGDTNPKPTDQLVFYLDVRDGFPKAKPLVSFRQGKIHAGINTFVTGQECIDAWVFDENHAGKNTTLAGTVRKTLMDIIYEPSVSRYDSPANSSLISWQRSKTEQGLFPTCPIEKVLRSENSINKPKKIPELPKPQIKRKHNPPELP